MRKINEVLRLRFEVGLALRAIARIARLVSELYTSICNEPKLPAQPVSYGRLARAMSMACRAVGSFCASSGGEYDSHKHHSNPNARSTFPGVPVSNA